MIELCVCFFFQAEDGIRDLVRSRGLGDVYKRQAIVLAMSLSGCAWASNNSADKTSDTDILSHDTLTVSYTHLTLPTSDLV